MEYYLKFSPNGIYLKNSARCSLATPLRPKTYTMTAGFIHTEHVVEAADEAAAIVALGLVPYVAPIKPMQRISKFELTQKLITAGKADGFAALIDALPTAEKLVWHAANTIEPDNAMLVAYRSNVLLALGMTGEEFDNLFR